MNEPKPKPFYEMITPPNPLKNKVRMLRGAEAKIDPVKRAEQAIERLSANFADWMDEDVERLIRQWDQNKSLGFTAETKAALYRAAHDLRGQAPTLGFPSAGRIAGILCDLLDVMGDDAVPDAFLEQYVTAIRAIVRETQRGEENELAGRLADELCTVGQALIEKHKAEHGTEENENQNAA